MVRLNYAYIHAPHAYFTPTPPSFVRFETSKTPAATQSTESPRLRLHLHLLVNHVQHHTQMYTIHYSKSWPDYWNNVHNTAACQCTCSDASPKHKAAMHARKHQHIRPTHTHTQRHARTQTPNATEATTHNSHISATNPRPATLPDYSDSVTV